MYQKTIRKTDALNHDGTGFVLVDRALTNWEK